MNFIIEDLQKRVNYKFNNVSEENAIKIITRYDILKNKRNKFEIKFEEFELENIKKLIDNNTINNKFGVHNIKEEPIEYNGDLMWRIYKFDCRDLFPDGEIGEGTYPAFICGKREIDYIDIARYPASKNDDEIPESVEKENMEEYWTNISLDEARSRVYAKNSLSFNGYHLLNIWEWALVSYLYEIKYDNQYKNKNCSHNGNKNGIRYMFDKNKICNWTLVDGFINKETKEEYNIIQSKFMMLENNNYNLCNDKKEKNMKNVLIKMKTFEDFMLFVNNKEFNLYNENDKNLIKLLKAALIINPNDYEFDGKIFYNSRDTVLLRGGNWADGASAGLGAFGLGGARSYVITHIGFRFARFD